MEGRMAYRDFDAARLEERQTLVEEIGRLDAERSRLESNLRRRAQLSQRLREIDQRMASLAAEHGELVDDGPVRSRRKRRFALAVAAMAAVGTAAGASIQAKDPQPTRPLLLLVKYVDRVGTEVQKDIDPGYYGRSSDDSYPEESRAR
jgi:hypothetical protein